MEVSKYLEECLRTGVQPEIPVILISNINGRVFINTMPAKAFWDAYRAGKFRNKNLLASVPEQDDNGRWLDVPQDSMLVIKGLIAGRDFRSVLN